ncbi:MAG TPA: amidohydrolase, partial [Candidatus Nanopelagicales bacterium]|nr:amidohydrolase [Candidatus Nanopelagicales bacterium]
MPAAPDLKARAAAAVEAARPEILQLSARVHANPEPAFEEFKAAAWCAEGIARHGFAVEHPAGRLATAVRGRLAGGKGADGPKIGVLAEYDALPGLGHGCGHNTMAASGVGAAIALAALRDTFAGEIVFLGTPAEERGSGKQFMLDDGLMDGLDAALLFHPGDRDMVGCMLLASEDVDVTFTGKAAHAAGEPWEGRNALDAAVLLFQGIGLWRQQLPQHARVHGIVMEGGTAANIIPDRATARFMIRSTDQAYFESMRARFRALVAGAAMMADVKGQL